MRILLLNQAFYPDTVATAQYLSDVAVALAGDGHHVTVLTSARAYDDPQRRFPRHEVWKGITIVRVSALAAGKTRRWRRALGFGTYLAACAARLLFLPRCDVIVALTSPPLISVLGALTAKLRGARLVFWVMDLNPDEAVAAGWLRPDSIGARVLQQLLRYSLRAADRVVTLDRYMADIVVRKGVPRECVTAIPPWSQDETVRFDAVGRTRFRREHGLDEKFVVMYSGNHGPCNPLDTVVDAIQRLSGNDNIRFCFVGGGSLFRQHEAEARRGRFPNAVFVPYQRRELLSATLSAADLHVVTMGDAFVGLIHPSKIYNLLGTGSPILYIGPERSAIATLVESIRESRPVWSVRHGNVDGTVGAILQASRRSDPQPSYPLPGPNAFGAEYILPRLLAEIARPAGVQSAATQPVTFLAAQTGKRE